MRGRVGFEISARRAKGISDHSHLVPLRSAARVLLLRAVLAEKTRSVGRCITLQPESSRPSWDYWCLRCQGFWPLPPLSPSFPSLPPSHQTPSFWSSIWEKTQRPSAFANYSHIICTDTWGPTTYFTDLNVGLGKIVDL